jgi:hypothetical protein
MNDGNINQKGEAPASTLAPIKGFSLVNPGGFITIYKVGKKTKFLNHDNKEVQYLDQKIAPATQEQLKEVYDSDASYVTIVKAPEGYEAPWNKKK